MEAIPNESPVAPASKIDILSMYPPDLVNAITTNARIIGVNPTNKDGPRRSL
jgi:hypothetical protein